MRYGFGFLGVFALSLMLSIGCSEGGTGDGGPVLISARDGGNASDPEVTVDPSGNAVAVFSQSDGTHHIFANRFTPTAGWGAPEVVDDDDGADARGAQVAVDSSGNAVAVWVQSDSIFANRFTPTAGWGAPEVIGVGFVDAAPQVAVDSSGNAVAVWEQFNTFANRFTPTAGWGAPEVIGVGVGPQVAVDPSGNAVAVGQLFVDGTHHIFANRFTPTAGWGAPEVVDDDDGADARGAQVAVDPSGNAVVVWEQSEGVPAPYTIFANRFTPTAGWGAPEQIETDDGGYAAYPQVAVDTSGTAVAVWMQSEGDRFNIFANRFTPAAGWGAAEQIETGDYAAYPQVAVDPSGNAIAVWQQQGGARDTIFANRFTPTAGWGAAERIETDDEVDAFLPQVAVDPSSNAVVVWVQSDGTRYSIWANRFDEMFP